MTVSTPLHDPSRSAPGEPAIRLELRPDSLAVPIARAATRRSFKFRDEDSESAFLVALTEIITNAVAEHARLGVDEPVTVTLHMGEVPFVEVADRGEGLDPQRAYDPDSDVVPEPDVEAGRGIIVARGFVPSLEFTANSEGTRARLPLDDLGRARIE